MRHPRTVMTFSDSGAHVSQIADSSIQTHLLGHWVRDRQAVHARGGGAHDHARAGAWRGASPTAACVREGMVADLNVFDPGVVAPAVPEVVNDLPGGGKRLSQRVVGFRATLVDGQVTIRDGEPTGERPGRLLRNRLARHPSAP